MLGEVNQAAGNRRLANSRGRQRTKPVVNGKSEAANKVARHGVQCAIGGNEPHVA